MIDQVEIVAIEPPESARFVNILPATSAQYVLYSSTSALSPASYDQVLKNHVLPVGGNPASVCQPFGVETESS